MEMKTKIKKDGNGLYLKCDGWIGRPSKDNNFETGLKEGQQVWATHPAGSTIFIRSKPRGEPEGWDVGRCYLE